MTNEKELLPPTLEYEKNLVVLLRDLIKAYSEVMDDFKEIAFTHMFNPQSPKRIIKVNDLLQTLQAYTSYYLRKFTDIEPFGAPKIKGDK